MKTKTNELTSAIKTIISAIGEDTDREGLRDTPARVVKSYAELFSGYGKDPAHVMKTFEEGACDEMVVLTNIEFYSFCEHHMLPFYGKAHVAYVPDRRVIGISKLARLVDIFARRLQIQERIGDQVVEALVHHLQPIGAACILEARHFCMMARGVGKQNSVMTTSSLHGAFKDNASARQELFDIIQRATRA